VTRKAKLVASRFAITAVLTLGFVGVLLSVGFLRFVSKFTPKRKATLLVSVSTPGKGPAPVSEALAVVRRRLGKRLVKTHVEGTKARIEAKTYGPSDLELLKRIIQSRGSLSFRRASSKGPGKSGGKGTKEQPAGKRFYMLDGPTESVPLSTKPADALGLSRPPEKVAITRSGADRAVLFVASEEERKKLAKWQSASTGAPVYLLVDDLILGRATFAQGAAEIKPKAYLSRARLAEIVRVMRGGALPAPVTITGTMLGAE